MANFWTASSELIRPCWWGSHAGTLQTSLLRIMWENVPTFPAWFSPK